MNLWPLMGLGLAASLVPLVKTFLTAPVRRLIKYRMNDSALKRVLLTPLGYTKRARDEAANAALLEDLLVLHQISQPSLSSGSGRITQRLRDLR